MSRETESMKKVWDGIEDPAGVKVPDFECVYRDALRAERRRRIMRISWAAAAAVVIALVIGGMWKISSADSSSEILMVEVSTSAGEILPFTLPDGSKVWLNSSSVLSYPSQFTSSREVELQGEAFFEVAKMEGSRFVVNAADCTIEVLGTRFDVDAYAFKGRSIRTTLVEGRVKFCLGDEAVMMTPGQMVDYIDGQISLRDVDTRSAEKWKDGLIVMDDMPLSDALRMVGNRFGVDFSISKPDLDYLRFNGVFDNQSLETIISFFEKSEGLRFNKVAPDLYQVL